MLVVDMPEAKNSLPRLVDAVESGAESEVVIARNGRPAARLLPLDTTDSGQRLGVARGRFEVPDSIDTDDAGIAEMFGRTPRVSDDTAHLSVACPWKIALPSIASWLRRLFASG